MSGQTSKPEQCPFLPGARRGARGAEAGCWLGFAGRGSCGVSIWLSSLGRPLPPPRAPVPARWRRRLAHSRHRVHVMITAAQRLWGQPVLGSGLALSLEVWPGATLPVFLTTGSWEVTRVKPLTAPVVTGPLTSCKQPCEVGGLSKAQRGLAVCARSHRGKVCIQLGFDPRTSDCRTPTRLSTTHTGLNPKADVPAGFDCLWFIRWLS